MKASFQWKLRADEKDVMLSRRSARLFLEHHGVAPDDVDELELVLGEMCANVVRHAYHGRDRGDYEVELTLDGDLVTMTVTDYGRGCTGIVRPPEEFSENGGMGFYLMSRYSDHLEITAGAGGGTAVRARRKFRRYNAGAPPKPNGAARAGERRNRPAVTP